MKKFILLIVFVISISITPIQAEEELDYAKLWNMWPETTRQAFLAGYVFGSNTIYTGTLELLENPDYMDLTLSNKKKFLQYHLITGEITNLCDKISELYTFPKNAKKPPQILIITNKWKDLIMQHYFNAFKNIYCSNYVCF